MRKTAAGLLFMAVCGAAYCRSNAPTIHARAVGDGLRVEELADSLTALSDKGVMFSVRVLAGGRALRLEHREEYTVCELAADADALVEVTPGPGAMIDGSTGTWGKEMLFRRGAESARLLLDGTVNIRKTRNLVTGGPFTGSRLALAVRSGKWRRHLLAAHVEPVGRMWDGKGPAQWNIYALGTGTGEQKFAIHVPAEGPGKGDETVGSFTWQPVREEKKRPVPHGRGCEAVRYMPLNRKAAKKAEIRVVNDKGGKADVVAEVDVSGMKPETVPGLAKETSRYFRIGEEPFYPIGKNVAWLSNPATEYPAVFRKMRRSGQNTCRIWAASWHVGLHGPDGNVNHLNAHVWDGLFEAAYREKIYIIPVLDNAYDVTENAKRHPLMKSTGAGDVGAFMQSEDGKAAMKAYVSDCRARWQCMPSLLSLEVMNEPDYALLQKKPEWQKRLALEKTLVPWATSVAGDVKRPGLTMGLWSGAAYPQLLKLQYLTQIHVFLPPEEEIREIEDFNAADLVVRELRAAARYAKGPVIVGEFGYRPPSQESYSPDVAKNHLDKEGIALRNALWASLAGGAAGPALPWWWDSHIEKYGLDVRIGALGRFLKLTDLEGLCEEPLPAPAGMEVNLYGMRGEEGAFLLLLDPDATARNMLMGAVPKQRESLTMSLPGMTCDRYNIRFWDINTGEIVGEYGQEPARDGWLFLKIPAFREGLTVTIKADKSMK